MEEREINPCQSCRAVCCGPNIDLNLTMDEARFIRSSGTELLLLDFPAGNNLNEGRFSLRSRCGFVSNKHGFLGCDEYCNPQRPKICGLFQAGSTDCKEIRAT